MATWEWIDPHTEFDRLVDAFQRCGRALFQANMNNSHSGNLSVRAGDHIWIKRTRTMCHELTPDDIIKTTFVPTSEEQAQLSSEFIVHRAIYQATDYRAIVHCHALQAITLAFLVDEIIPPQIDGYGVLPGRIPVIEVVAATASQELCDALTPVMRQFPAVMVRGHGLFVGAESLDAATYRAFIVENAAQMLLTLHGLGVDMAPLLDKPYLKVGYPK